MSHAKQFSQRLLVILASFIHGTYTLCIVVTKATVRTSFSKLSTRRAGIWTSAFAGHILKIIFLCSKEQVLRIAARSIVAVMANENASLHLNAMMKFIGKFMSWHRPSINRESPVTPFSLRPEANPFPTFRIGFFVDAHPKSFGRRKRIPVNCGLRVWHCYKSYCCAASGQALAT